MKGHYRLSLFLFLLFVQIVGAGFASASESIVRGRLLEKGTKIPMAGAVFYVLPEKLRLAADDEGRFEKSLPDGPHTLAVNIPGYLKTRLEFTSPTPKEVTVLVEKAVYNPYETTVETKAATVQTSQKNISAEEAAKTPGTGGDALKAVQAMPGTARSRPLFSNVIIRGSGPNDTKYLIDGVEVPNIFHFGGTASVVTTEFLDDIIYLPGGFGAPYGRATGGIVGTNIRDPQTDRVHGDAFVDVINAGFVVETPLGDGWSIGLTGRRSYVGDILGALASKNPDQFSFTVAPFYYDGLLRLTKKFSDTRKFTFTAIGSYDELSFVLANPTETEPAIRGPFDDITKFNRLIASYSDKFSENDTFLFTTSYGTDSVFVDFNNLYLDLNAQTVAVKTDWQHRETLWSGTRVGIDNIYRKGTVNFALPPLNGDPISPSNTIQGKSDRQEAQTGFYAEQRIGLLDDPEKWTVTPGVRIDHFTATNEVLFGPRLASRYALSETAALRASGGIYYQPPDPQDTDPFYGNASLKAPMAIHYDLGAELEPRINGFNSFSIEGDLFYKSLQRLVIADPVAHFSNDGSGQAYGLEILAKFVRNQIFGELSYTLSRSLRTSPSQGTYTFDYDQTHNFNLIVGYKTSAQWQYGLRLRYVTGNPNTPYVAAFFDSDNDVYTPLAGALYSSRLPAYFEADFRIDKRWVYPSWILNLYLDIQNLTNNQNVEGVSYNYDFSQQQYTTGLPIIPNVGVRAEF